MNEVRYGPMGPTITTAINMFNSANPESEPKMDGIADAKEDELPVEVVAKLDPLEVECQPSTSSAVEVARLSPIDMQLYDEKRRKLGHCSMELNRRLAKLQMKEVAHMSQGAIANFVKQTGDQLSQLQAGLNIQSLTFDEKLVRKLAILRDSGTLPANGFHRQDLGQMTPEGLVKFLQRYKRSGRKLPPELLPRLKKPNPPEGLNAEQMVREVTWVSDLLDETQRGRDWDSDATDSDGSDSEDLMSSIRRTAAKLPPTNVSQHEEAGSSIEKSARWMWNRERTAVGSRLSWLQSEVTTLDLRIRQHVDIHRHARAAKIPVVLEESLEKTDSSTDEPDGCARVKAARSSKRRVVKIQGMFKVTKKAHRLATVHCGCSPPYSPCVMCCGRTNNIQTQSDLSGLSGPEKYALIDHDYHMVLSDQRDTGLEPRMAAVAALNSTRQRSSTQRRSLHRKVVVAGVPLGTVPFSESQRRRRSREEQVGMVDVPLSKVKRSSSSDSFLEVDVTHSDPIETEVSRLLTGHRQKSSSRSNSGAGTPSGISPLCVSLSTSLCESGMPSPRPNGVGKPGQVTSRRSTAAPQLYDIDNIIIDPSVAAVTRVEKLQYKEIMTPGWREIDRYQEKSHSQDQSDLMEMSNSSDEIEAVDDTDYANRHWEKEMLEKRKFETYKSWTVGASLHKSRLMTESPSASPSHHAASLSSSTASFSALEPGGSTASPLSLPYPIRKFPLDDTEYLAILEEQHEVETAVDGRKYEVEITPDFEDEDIMWDE